MVRRAQIRSVVGNDVANAVIKRDINEDILCQLSDVNSELFDNTSSLIRHGDCIDTPTVSKNRQHGARVIPEGPINNFPSYQYDGGVPDAVTLEIFSLRRKNAEQHSRIEELQSKLTKALECLQSQKRFLRLWIYDEIGESYDKMQQRMRDIDGTIRYVESLHVGPRPEIKIPERWRKSIFVILPMLGTISGPL